SRPGLPADVLEACARVGSLAGTRLLGVELAPGGDGWALSGASVLPELRLGGERLLDALEQELST
ncbi:MAG TPA: hypothetical protein VFL87_04395, partial [Thermoleophilaceae bacterium]|nr:hypothetical protein [Thermoleophilaceae bacterium]